MLEDPALFRGPGSVIRLIFPDCLLEAGVDESQGESFEILSNLDRPVLVFAFGRLKKTVIVDSFLESLTKIVFAISSGIIRVFISGSRPQRLIFQRACEVGFELFVPEKAGELLDFALGPFTASGLESPPKSLGNDWRGRAHAVSLSEGEL